MNPLAQSLLFALSVPMAAFSVFGMQNPWTVALQRQMFKVLPANVPDFDVLIENYYKGILDDKAFTERLADYGIPNVYASEIITSTKKVADAYEIITLFRRGLLADKNEFYQRMQENRIQPKDADRFLAATEYFPSPLDLVRFAVREVYTPNIVQGYGLDLDLPEQFLTEAAKTGLPKDQAVNYWRAHWELPSASEGFEFLHRFAPDMPEKYWQGYQELGIQKEDLAFGVNDMSLLLKSLDFMPPFRNRLIGLSYQPVTRVDIRRMYQMGIYDEDAVYWSYRKIGYDPKDARDITAFTVKEYRQEEIDLSKAEVLSMFSDDVFSETDTRSFLASLGLDEFTVDALITREKLKKSKAILDMQIADYKALYERGYFDLDTLRTKLTEMGMMAAKVDHIILQEQFNLSAKIKVASRATLQGWLKKGLIDRDEFLSRMEINGYSVDDSEKYAVEMAG